MDLSQDSFGIDPYADNVSSLYCLDIVYGCYTVRRRYFIATLCWQSMKLYVKVSFCAAKWNQLCHSVRQRIFGWVLQCWYCCSWWPFSDWPDICRGRWRARPCIRSCPVWWNIGKCAELCKARLLYSEDSRNGTLSLQSSVSHWQKFIHKMQTGYDCGLWCRPGHPTYSFIYVDCTD